KEKEIAAAKLLDAVNEIAERGGAVAFGDEIDNVKRRCDKYEKKAAAAGQTPKEYKNYIIKLLEEAIQKNDNLVSLIKIKEERQANDREKSRIVDGIKDKKIEELERENKEKELRLKEAYRKDRNLEKKHKRWGSGFSIDLSTGNNTPSDRPSTPTTPSPIQKDSPTMDYVEDAVRGLRKKHEDEKAGLTKEYEEQIRALREKLEEANAKNERLNSVVEVDPDDYENLLNERDGYVDKVSNLEIQIEVLQEKLDELKRGAVANDPHPEEEEKKCNLIKDHHKELEAEIEELKEELSEKEVKIVALEDRINELENANNNNEQNKQEITDEKTTHEKIHGKAEKDYFKSARKSQKSEDKTKFAELLNLLNEAKENNKTVFIPVNNANSPDDDGTHWSLLVYESKKFYHFDSSGGTNYEYVEDTVKELLKQLGTKEE
ncbi:34807_t:CDS:2, partial [Racocetra persica]